MRLGSCAFDPALAVGSMARTWSPLSLFALRAALALAGVASILGFEPEAHAVGANEAPESLPPADAPPAPIVWGLRLNGSAGASSMSDARDGGAAWRFGLDAEYWLSKNVGVGAQFGVQGLDTINWCTGDCFTEHANRFSLAPAITLRGSKPAIFPTISLALGLSTGHTEAYQSCEFPNSGCQSVISVTDTWGPYGSLTGAWLFHTGDVPPGSMAFAIGPLVRTDCFLLSASTYGCTFTTGVTIGFGMASDL
jgi:disulfide bond formation protein DsbB